MEINARNYKLDNLRTLAILIVVIGHSLILYDPSWGIVPTTVTYEPFHIVKSVINVIQMPLFYSLSGYLFYWTLNNRSLKYIAKQKIKRILVPFVIVLLLYTDPIKIYLGIQGFESIDSLMNRHLFLMDLGHLWFIPVLFATFILSYYPARIRSDRFQIFFLLILINLNVISSKFPQHFQIGNIACYLLYFYFGILVNRWNLLIRF